MNSNYRVIFEDGVYYLQWYGKKPKTILNYLLRFENMPKWNYFEDRSGHPDADRNRIFYFNEDMAINRLKELKEVKENEGKIIYI